MRLKQTHFTKKHGIFTGAHTSSMVMCRCEHLNLTLFKNNEKYSATERKWHFRTKKSSIWRQN